MATNSFHRPAYPYWLWTSPGNGPCFNISYSKGDSPNQKVVPWALGLSFINKPITQDWITQTCLFLHIQYQLPSFRVATFYLHSHAPKVHFPPPLLSVSSILGQGASSFTFPIKGILLKQAKIYCSNSPPSRRGLSPSEVVGVVGRGRTCQQT